MKNIPYVPVIACFAISLVIAIVSVALLPLDAAIASVSFLFGLGAVTSNQSLEMTKHTHELGIPMHADAEVFHNTLVFVSATGFAVHGPVVAGLKFGGISTRYYSNVGGSNGDVTCEVYTDGKFLLTGAGFTQADVGVAAFGTDNFTVAKAGDVRIGTIKEFVSATQVWVEIDTQAA